MAKQDFYGGGGKNDVSGRVDNSDEYRTANERVNETVYASPDAENREEALDEGVLDAAYIDYDAALDTLAAREDMESFDSYTRRSYGVTGADFANQGYMRELPNRSGGNGVAPDPANEIVVGTDADGDGFAASSDSDDDDPAVH